MEKHLQKLSNDGYFITSSICQPEIISTLKDILSSPDNNDKHNAIRKHNGDIFGTRNVLQLFPSLLPVIKDGIIYNLAQDILGPKAKIVRSIYFDKTKNANWIVPIHQDQSIAVTERHDIDGFSAWSVKASITHVQPPENILQNMVTLRVHLDDTTHENGALRVISGSHKRGKMKQANIVALSHKQKTILCPVEEGAIMVMRPLLLHESSAGRSPSRRRVLHLEFSADDLPAPLQWCENNN